MGIEGSVPMRPDKVGVRWSAARGSSPITLQDLRHHAPTAMLDAGEVLPHCRRHPRQQRGEALPPLRRRNDTGERKAIAALEQ
ncbi:MAG TPA: hypothetical protein VM242_04070 [Acidimicrobiales bacterium]|nr:hypothetical protein [Acidimicrobiales bacterium]